jgi:DNA mismatch repair ATPase MutS
MHVHVGRIKKDAVLLRAHPDFIKLSETGSTMTFFFKEWSVLGSQIIETSSAIFAAERDAFEQLRTEINAQSAPLRRNARVVDELDVTLGFADLADEMRWVRPELTEEYAFSFCRSARAYM